MELDSLIKFGRSVAVFMLSLVLWLLVALGVGSLQDYLIIYTNFHQDLNYEEIFLVILVLPSAFAGFIAGATLGSRANCLLLAFAWVTGGSILMLYFYCSSSFKFGSSNLVFTAPSTCNKNFVPTSGDIYDFTDLWNRTNVFNSLKKTLSGSGYKKSDLPISKFASYDDIPDDVFDGNTGVYFSQTCSLSPILMANKLFKEFGV